jgi:hypothetical protein
LRERSYSGSKSLFSLFNPEFALGIPEIMGGGVKRVKK